MANTTDSENSVPCIRCGALGSRVMDSRQNAQGFRNRRRLCMSCNYRWTTVEVPEHVFRLIAGLTRRVRYVQQLATQLGDILEAIPRALPDPPERPTAASSLFTDQALESLESGGADAGDPQV